MTFWGWAGAFWGQHPAVVVFRKATSPGRLQAPCSHRAKHAGKTKEFFLAALPSCSLSTWKAEMPLRPHWAGTQSSHPVPSRQLQRQHCHPLHCAFEMISPNPGSEGLCSRIFTQALPWKEVGWVCCQNNILNHLNAAEKPHFCCNAWGFRDGEKGSGSSGFPPGLQDLEGMKKFSKIVHNS